MSLGYTNTAATKPQRPPVAPSIEYIVETTTVVVPTVGCYVPKGLLPLTVFSVLAFLPPLLTIWTVDQPGYDRLDKMVPPIFSIVVAFLIPLCNCPKTTFNMALGFHAGCETLLLNLLYDSSSATYWVFFGVIIAHLVPFVLLPTSPTLLAFLSTVGVCVNAFFAYWGHYPIVYVVPSALLLQGVTCVVVVGLRREVTLVGLLRDTFTLNTMPFLGCFPYRPQIEA